MFAKEFVGQVFGIIGLLLFIFSFQCKNNRKLVFIQGIGGLMFFINFLLIEAYGGALFNLTALLRGLLYTKENGKIWRLWVVELMFTASYVYSLTLIGGDVSQIVLTTLPYISLLVISWLMWKGNGRFIRYCQVAFLSPSWLIHNIFNFTLGGILTEAFNIVSAIVSLVRFKGVEDSK